jgi:hypothetical protein
MEGELYFLKREITVTYPQLLACCRWWAEPHGQCLGVFPRMVAIFSKQDFRSLRDHVSMAFVDCVPLNITERPDGNFRRRLNDLVEAKICTLEEGYENCYSVADYLTCVAEEAGFEAEIKAHQLALIASSRRFWHRREYHLNKTPMKPVVQKPELVTLSSDEEVAPPASTATVTKPATVKTAIVPPAKKEKIKGLGKGGNKPTPGGLKNTPEEEAKRVASLKKRKEKSERVAREAQEAEKKAKKVVSKKRKLEATPKTTATVTRVAITVTTGEDGGRPAKVAKTNPATTTVAISTPAVATCTGIVQNPGSAFHRPAGSGPRPLTTGVVWPVLPGSGLVQVRPGPSAPTTLTSIRMPPTMPVVSPYALEFRVGKTYYKMENYLSRMFFGKQYPLPFYDQNGVFKMVPGLDQSLIGRARVTPACLWRFSPLLGKMGIGTMVVRGVTREVYDFNECAWCILFGVREAIWEGFGGLCWWCKDSRGLLDE